MLLRRRASRAIPRFWGAPGWLPPYVAARLIASLVAIALVSWHGVSHGDALMLLYGPLSTAALGWLPRLRRTRWVWALDFAAGLGLIVLSGNWRSPYYLLWLTSLVLPAAALPPLGALWLAVGACLAFLAVAIGGGPSPGHLQPVSSEVLAIHVVLPFMLVASVAYAADALRRLSRERSRRERLAIEAERRRIAWDLHDSAKQRLHAAHLLVSSLRGRVEPPLDTAVERAAVELESAASEMDTSVAELRSPLEGRRLDVALGERAEQLAAGSPARISVRGAAPPLPPLVAAHAYRIGCEALTNALRHADAGTIDVAIERVNGGMRLEVTDDGRGVPSEPRAGASGLQAMESRALTLGGRLSGDRAPMARVRVFCSRCR